ncbi:hypothetical protein [Streptomyces sp. MST-110588]|uniref:hypothetical protein n=1 Tax=Streptomyces sp. MST-110588 TaxID=2833628 RepID=UPI001F5C5BBD|nr:hypothetical protein [Streptomyces sp. MST-110588]UNO42957.1 hypothetical protein KGS77_29920 [Streptomyces sp. MST-110588]
MTPPPPPPPLGRPRRKDTLVLTPALDDSRLVSAVDALTHGRWAHVRTLLAETGQDWDRRGHRLVVLAQGSTSAAWARDWRLAEPDSADAAALLALSHVQLALRGKESEESAQDACRVAARMAPADPTPWLGMLLLARRRGTADQREHAFDQVRARHPDHHHAHHLMAACLAEHRPGDTGDPLHQVYDFAAWAAEQAPADSPLAILPVVAHAERYRALAAAGLQPPDPAASGHWTTRRARQVMKAAFDWWLEWEGEDHPRAKVDLNFLAHAKFHEGRMAEAAALFERIGPYATAAPWSYPDRDPRKAFRAARDLALRSA